MLIPSFAALADALVAPENAFYSRHRDYVVSLNRSFSANGADGYASVKKAPDSGREVGRIPNGEVEYFHYSCMYDGEYWAFSFSHSGWVRIDQLLVQYDFISFEEDHSKEFHDYNGDFAELEEAGAAIMWPWPGAEEPVWTMEDIELDNFYFRFAYTDSHDREWGFIMYWRGVRNFWICISDPLNDEIPAFNPAPGPRPWTPSHNPDRLPVHINIEPSGSPGLLITVVISVAVLVVATAVLIWVFWKQGKRKLPDSRTE